MMWLTFFPQMKCMADYEMETKLAFYWKNISFIDQMFKPSPFRLS